MRPERSPRSRGFTLVEIMVAALLVLILLGLAVGVLGPAGRAFLRAQERSDAQQAALVVLNRLRGELSWSHPSVVSVQSSPLSESLVDGSAAHEDSIRWVSCRADDGRGDFTAEGALRWHRQVALWLQDGRVLEADNVDPLADSPTLDALLHWIVPTTGEHVRVVSRNVRSLSLTRSSDGLVQIRIDTQVEAETVTLKGTAGPTLPTDS